MPEFPPSFDNRDGYIWFNGKIVDWRDAKIHVLNHGLHYGSCVFEGVRIYGGNVFKLEEHNIRLHKSAELLGFKIPFSVEELNLATEKVVKENNIVDGYLRPVAWRGSEQMAIRTDRSTIHTAICTWEMPAYFGEEALQKGLDLTFAKWKRPSPETEPVHAKAAGLYMICTLSKNTAMDNGFDDAIMLDWRGYLAEATGANLFLVIDGELHTPLPDCFLDGITRRTVIELAKQNGIKIVERHIKPEELQNAQEAFLTGSAAELTPIGSIKGEYSGEGGNKQDDFNFVVGDITQKLMQGYKDLVRNWKN